LLGSIQTGDQQEWQRTFKPFLLKHAAIDVRERFSGIAERLAASGNESSMDNAPQVESDAVLIAAFLVSELRNAFQIGLLLIVPFLILDLIVMNILMCLGIVQLPYQVISLPLKFALFCMIDGWTLLADKLVSAYI
jgi:flagellar biosynthesis protein FliP